MLLKKISKIVSFLLSSPTQTINMTNDSVSLSQIMYVKIMESCLAIRFQKIIATILQENRILSDFHCYKTVPVTRAQ